MAEVGTSQNSQKCQRQLALCKCLITNFGWKWGGRGCLTWTHLSVTRRLPVTLLGDISSMLNPMAPSGGSRSSVFEGWGGEEEDGAPSMNLRPLQDSGGPLLQSPPSGAICWDRPWEHDSVGYDSVGKQKFERMQRRVSREMEEERGKLWRFHPSPPSPSPSPPSFGRWGEVRWGEVR